MKKLFLLTYLLLLTLNCLPIRVFYYYLIFYDIDNKPYVEFYFAIEGNSVTYKMLNNDVFYKSIVNLSIKVQRGDSLFFYQKYHVVSPNITDTLNVGFFAFMDRVYILPGKYIATFEIEDSLNKSDRLIFNDSLFIDKFEKNSIFFSDIQPLEKFEKSEKVSLMNKNGFLISPYISDFYPENINTLIAYVELYNTSEVLGQGQKFAIKYYINKTYSSLPFENYQNIKVLQAQKIIPLFLQFDISNLTSGNYYLTIECLNAENTVLARKQFYFQRLSRLQENKIKTIIQNLNPSFFEKYNNIDTLRLYLKCMIPVAESHEIENINSALKSNEIKLLQETFLNFWQRRNTQDPEMEWLKYYESVKYVNTVYGYKKVIGCLTDRGRVYLKYGPPDHIIESKHEPSAYPYEIWQYYVLKNFRNRHFVFYNPTLAYKEYVLLHSDMPGEVYDRNWERRLHSRNNSMYNFDATESDEQFGSRAKENYNK